MKKKKYVNIHPSFLPDLRGIDPVLGSILFKRDAGATCHIMSEKIDAGDAERKQLQQLTFQGKRDQGTGRPTKKERRDLENLTEDEQSED